MTKKETVISLLVGFLCLWIYPWDKTKLIWLWWTILCFLPQQSLFSEFSPLLMPPLSIPITQSTNQNTMTRKFLLKSYWKIAWMCLSLRNIWDWNRKKGLQIHCHQKYIYKMKIKLMLISIISRAKYEKVNN